MEPKKIYPIIIEKGKVYDCYKKLIDNEYQLKIFNKKTNKDIYDYFLPTIRDYMLWTFQMKDVGEFKKMQSDLQATVCCNYDCNIFEKGKDQFICFASGIILALCDDDETERIIPKQDREDLEEINIRNDVHYDCAMVIGDSKKIELEVKDEDDKKVAGEKNSTKSESKVDYCHTYLYVLQLYKMIYLSIINKQIANPNLFDKVRNGFVNFTQKVYDVKITDQDDMESKVGAELQLEKTYIEVENKFDLFYKNNKMNDHHVSINIFITLLVIAIIIGIINLIISLGI